MRGLTMGNKQGKKNTSVINNHYIKYHFSRMLNQ